MLLQKKNKTKSWKYGYDSEYDFVCISKDGTLGQIININGLNIGLPARPKKIRFEEKTNDLQKWMRYEIPKELVHFDKIFKDEPNQESGGSSFRTRTFGGKWRKGEYNMDNLPSSWV